nr:sugar transporter ERD6-like 6 [Hydra vulgaris]
MTYDDEQTSLNASFSLSEDNEQFTTLFIAVVIASIASVCVGFSIGYTSPYNTEYTKLSNEILFASLLGIGAVVGLILGGFCLEYFGRKKGIMLSALFYTPGWVLIGYYPNKTNLYIGRMLTGVATGLCSLTVPIYIAEVSSFKYRGRLGVVNQIGITIEIFLAFLIGSYGNSKQSATAAFVIALVMEVLVLFIPESPRWLFAKKMRYEACKTLKWLRGSSYDVEDECIEIEHNLGMLRLFYRRCIKISFDIAPRTQVRYLKGLSTGGVNMGEMILPLDGEDKPHMTPLLFPCEKLCGSYYKVLENHGVSDFSKTPGSNEWSDTIVIYFSEQAVETAVNNISEMGLYLKQKLLNI